MNLTKYIGKQFSNPEGIGGKLSTFFMNHFNQTQYRSVFYYIPKKRNQSILDIGFGNGYLLNQLAKKYPFQYYGIEISKDMILEAKKRNQTHIRKKKMHLQFGTIMKMPFDREMFDFIYTINTIYFWSEPMKGFQEILRVLKKGGTAVIVFYTKEWLDKIKYTKYGFIKYTPQELMKKAKIAEFSSGKLIEIKKNKSYCIVLKK